MHAPRSQTHGLLAIAWPHQARGHQDFECLSSFYLDQSFSLPPCWLVVLFLPGTFFHLCMLPSHLSDLLRDLPRSPYLPLSPPGTLHHIILLYLVLGCGPLWNHLACPFVHRFIVHIFPGMWVPWGQEPFPTSTFPEKMPIHIQRMNEQLTCPSQSTSSLFHFQFSLLSLDLFISAFPPAPTSSSLDCHIFP